MKKNNEQCKLGSVGGEALMEGIMMRGPNGAAMSLRLPDGTIETTLKQTKLPSERCKLLGWPIIRGPVSLIYSMVFGYKCMMESAEKATIGVLEETGEVESKLDRWIEKHLGEKFGAIIGVLGTLLGLGLAVGLFILAPEKLAGLLQRHTQVDLTRFMPLIAGGMRIVLFVGYMFVMSQLKDIRRVFQYHGAEHKSIFCYESGLPLTVENVRAQSRLHPRCGTSFLFVMILLSILFSSAITLLLPADLRAVWQESTWLRAAFKILQLPAIMALGYEFIRFAGKHLSNPVVRIFSAPGLLMQRITTKEPDDGVIEVGIEALKAALGMEYSPRIPALEAAATTEDTPAGNPGDTIV
ncbi:MAG: DUF1385 domain-containing protein [Oscillospiraceae bacterium]|jgi:uncharacterized protein YqhQ|nr:DUF1385 domain-containing protein [Oscillospiraceae bacterium]